MIALDTNILIYARRAATPEHAAAITALESARQDPRGWGIPFPVIAEFWSIVTGPGAVPLRAAPESAAAFLSDLWRAGAQPWLPRPGMQRRLVEWACRLQVRGVRIFDLQIGLIAQDHGAREIWTHDADFLRLPGLAIRDPLA